MTREDIEKIADDACKSENGLILFLAYIYDKLLDLEELIKQGQNGGDRGDNPA